MYRCCFSYGENGGMKGSTLILCRVNKYTHNIYWKSPILILGSLIVLRFYGPVNPMGSCRARSVYLTTRLLGRLSPLTSIVHILSPETDNCPS